MFIVLKDVLKLLAPVFCGLITEDLNQENVTGALLTEWKRGKSSIDLKKCLKFKIALIAKRTIKVTLYIKV